MAKLTARDTAALRRIVKAASGRELSVGESYAALHYLLRLLHILGRTNEGKPRASEDQASLFDTHG